jgi:hypothetical protein
MRLIDYRLAPTEVQITVFGFVVRKFAYADIEDVLMGSRSGGENWARRFSGYVTIRRKRGLFRSVVITPDDPEGFVMQLKERINLFK